MKKILIGLFCTSSLAFGAVTEAQVDQATICFQQIANCAGNGLRYSQDVKALFQAGFKLQVAGSTTTVTIPQALQDELINVQGYQARKAACAAAYNTCP